MSNQSEISLYNDSASSVRSVQAHAQSAFMSEVNTIRQKQSQSTHRSGQQDHSTLNFSLQTSELYGRACNDTAAITPQSAQYYRNAASQPYASAHGSTTLNSPYGSDHKNSYNCTRLPGETTNGRQQYRVPLNIGRSKF